MSKHVYYKCTSGIYLFIQGINKRKISHMCHTFPSNWNVLVIRSLSPSISMSFFCGGTNTRNFSKLSRQISPLKIRHSFIMNRRFHCSGIRNDESRVLQLYLGFKETCLRTFHHVKDGREAYRDFRCSPFISKNRGTEDVVNPNQNRRTFLQSTCDPWWGEQEDLPRWVRKLQGWRTWRSIMRVLCLCTVRDCAEMIFDFLQGVYVLWYKLERTAGYILETPLFFLETTGLFMKPRT